MVTFPIYFFCPGVPKKSRRNGKEWDKIWEVKESPLVGDMSMKEEERANAPNGN